MQIHVTDQPLAQVEADALLVALHGETVDPAIDQALGGLLSEIVERGDFKATSDDVLVLYPPRAAQEQGGLTISRVLVTGIPHESSLDRWIEAAARGAKKARKLNVQHLATTLANQAPPGYGTEAAAAAVVEGVIMATYRFEEHKTVSKKNKNALETLTFVAIDAAAAAAAERGARWGAPVARGVTLARDLVNGPPNIITPIALAERAQAIAASVPYMNATIYDREQARELGMGAFLAVAQGAGAEPRFIVLEHRLDEFPDQQPIVLIGKGITFDSGGLNIKPGDSMADMKSDMSGAAAVLGTFAALAEVDLPLPVVGLVPATENMVDAASFRPGDVMTNLSGKTIENLNSDAEGRLILSDALAYSERYQPRAIVDLATLTGAISVALGRALIGAFTTDQNLLDRLRQAGEKVGEPLWEMPLYEPYAKHLDSEVADIKNVGGRPGGAITAALFLKYFVPKDVPWTHLDIAGVAWNHADRKPKPPYLTPGATGVGVRLLMEFLQSYARP